ncbi:MAG: CvpA family protein [Firmicutes bacterium]|nr:CvpA family protein [Bacillota bacterium]
MTWLDWLVAGIFFFFIIRGYRRGFLQQFLDLLGSVVALILAFYFYQRVGSQLTGLLGLSEPFANMLGFILIIVLLGGSVSFFGKRWREHSKGEPVVLFDSAMGAILGGLKAAVILIIVLLVLVSLPFGFFTEQIEASSFANDLLRLAPLFYAIQNQSLPSNLPRLVVSPEGLQVRKITPVNLEGATCIACGTKVEYKGMVRKGLSVYPQTYCPKCRRTSDGCLTFEGYHSIHGVCPYERLGVVGLTDCKIWPNPEPTTVTGKCPVCGRSQ